MTVALSEILSNRRLSGDTVTFTASEDWMQGRTMFGGFLSALAVVRPWPVVIHQHPTSGIHVHAAVGAAE